MAPVILQQLFQQVFELRANAAAERREVEADESVCASGPYLRANAEWELIDLESDLHHRALCQRQRLLEGEQAALGAQVDDAPRSFQVLAYDLEA